MITEEVKPDQGLLEDMGLGGLALTKVNEDASLSVASEVLINGDKLFHVQSYDIGGGQRRYDGIWKPGNDGRPVVYGWTLSDLQKKNGELWQQGFRLSHQYSYDIGGGQRRYDAIWMPGNDGRPIVWGWTLDDLKKKNDELWKQGFRLTQQQAYDIGGGQWRYDAIWTPGNDGRPVVWGWTLADLQKRNGELWQQGFRMVHQYSYEISPGQRRYDAIWMPGNDGRPIVWGWTLADFQKKLGELYGQGYRLAHQHSYDIGGGQRRYDGIWMPANDGRGIVWGWTLDDFQVRLGELYNKRIAIGDQALSLPKLLSGIRQKLDGKCVGYGVVISYRGGVEFRYDAGLARTATNPPQQDFSVYRRTNLASVSKTLTAVGVVKLLTAKGLSIDTPIGAYLPSDWHRGPNVNSITFKQLLTHTSGIRNPNKLGMDYESVKRLVAEGIGTDKAYQYQNHNFALFRVIIPYLNGFKEQGVTDRGTALAQSYMNYMNANVFKPAGLKTVTGKPDATNPTLFYPFPAGKVSGWDFGDASLVVGGEGLHLSMDELNQFVSRLLYTDTVLNAQQRKLMEDHQLGWFRGNVTNGTLFSHGGYLWFPTDNGVASLNTSYYAFSIGVVVTLIHNSPVSPDPGNFVIDAFNGAWGPR
ncbi:LamG domain protein jellyroll fold domain protein [Fibrisoma limi BUZ 3]|uniref:LamG domain protein jellyroll fold domain protein n=1 Tax=Fibrisoma limi BUZ 3 TaxID=1185876 RepID=I2GFJ8_9BACT|nr:serine hydrolase [Fibrisoma limi]CCH52673.1 LamG domain protein jellyroll fold domain protein [Fibrisoma limi BUZ 3]